MAKNTFETFGRIYRRKQLVIRDIADAFEYIQLNVEADYRGFTVTTDFGTISIEMRNSGSRMVVCDYLHAPKTKFVLANDYVPGYNDWYISVRDSKDTYIRDIRILEALIRCKLLSIGVTDPSDDVIDVCMFMIADNELCYAGINPAVAARHYVIANYGIVAKFNNQVKSTTSKYLRMRYNQARAGYLFVKDRMQADETEGIDYDAYFRKIAKTYK